jgi:glycosyltransferase involved in cell wall biosynthesis
LEGSTEVRGEEPSIVDAMREVDFGVICSLGSEVNCRAALEWGWAGKMVLATDVGVIPEIIRQGQDGLILPPGDRFKLASALEWCLTHPGQVTNMGHNFRKRVEGNFNRVRFYQETLDFIKRVSRA